MTRSLTLELCDGVPNKARNIEIRLRRQLQDAGMSKADATNAAKREVVARYKRAMETVTELEPNLAPLLARKLQKEGLAQ